MAAQQTEQMDAILTAGLQNQTLVVTAAAERDLVLSGEKKLQNCTTPACLEQIGRVLSCRYVVYATAKKTGGLAQAKTKDSSASGTSDWQLELVVFHTDLGAVGARVQKDCKNCDFQAAGQMLPDLLNQAIVEEAAKPRGGLSITTKPLGALVFVDGTELGVTPFRRTTYSGKHSVTLRNAGFRSEQREIEVPVSQRLSLDIALSEGSDPLPQDGKNRVPVYKKWWFWVAVGGAALVGAAVTGAVLATPAKNGTPAPSHFVF